MKFCDSCGQILNINVKTDELKFICDTCGITIIGDKEDYKLFSENFIVKNNIEYLLKSVKYNPTLPRKYMDCPKCKKEELIYIIRENNTLKATYVCDKCEYYFN